MGTLAHLNRKCNTACKIESLDGTLPQTGGAILSAMSYEDDDMLAVVHNVDKLFRIAHSKHAFGESPYRDIAGYGLLGALRDAKLKL